MMSIEHSEMILKMGHDLHRQIMATHPGTDEEKRMFALLVASEVAANIFAELDLPTRMPMMRQWIKNVSANAEVRWLQQNGDAA